MSTRSIALIFILLVLVAGIFFFGGKDSNPAVPVHTMPDGTVMETTANVHMMPDGTMMAN